ncbi:MAG TPA: class I SAM-dependent methyltransferase [Bacteroidales bacterium]|jgi:SAM-dependent methyltransferase|nr:class I SAM-dependent methyltransferase [Bacteroidales bacterium]
MKTMNETLVAASAIEDVTTFLELLNLKGGPETQEEYDMLSAFADILSNEEIAEFRRSIPSALDMNTLMGHGYVKPYGYAGDFMLIEKIYQYTVNPDPRYRNWDIFFHNQPAAKAVRNRKKYFIRTLTNLVAEKKNARVLVLGSGPATDVFEFLSASGRKDITFDLVDLDQNAMDYSIKKNEKFRDQITFNRINALRYTPFKFYDLIWTAGLFDYFKDKHFAYLIRKYYNNLTEDGRLIIGNFNTKNPTKNMMEKLIEWILILRSESDLFRIAADAGIDNELVSVDSEPLGINLFMTIRKNLQPLN